MGNQGGNPAVPMHVRDCGVGGVGFGGAADGMTCTHISKNVHFFVLFIFLIVYYLKLISYT